jgi:heme-degrading monooxygenase HmoA
MICRLWHGWTTREDAAAYEAYLRDELYPHLDAELSQDGYRGHNVLRSEVGEEVEFVTLTWFDSLEAVQGFAGPHYERPVITETAAALLKRYDSKARHFDLVLQQLR